MPASVKSWPKNFILRICISFKDTVKLSASFESALVFCHCKYVGFFSHFRFAVGSYYFLIGKQELARRYLSRATQLDRVFGPSWLAYGHSFALENEHDQAIAAYFKVWKNVLGCNEFVVKFRYFEKATKFEKRLKLFWNYGKNLMWDFFSNFCSLLRVSETIKII